MKDRMLNPAVQWQTFDNPTMGTHVRMPCGVGLATTLALTADPGTKLGNIIVYRQSHPAQTSVGPHSYNGSDYTQVRDHSPPFCDVAYACVRYHSMRLRSFP